MEQEKPCFAESQKGKELLIFDGFVYRMDRKGQERSSWHCTAPRNRHCLGRVRLLMSDNLVTVVTDHNRTTSGLRPHGSKIRL